MKIKILADDQTRLERTIKVQVNAESVKQSWDYEVEKLRREVIMPGFRHGQAPRNLVERHIGYDHIWDRVKTEVSNEVTRELLKDADPKPLAPPKVTFDENEDDEVSNLNSKRELIVNITYLLPPQSPEDIEKDLLSRGTSPVSPDIDANPASWAVYMASHTFRFPKKPCQT